MGKVYLVGAGPGDSELITVKGIKCMKKADVILYDRLVNKDLLYEAKPYADLVYCGKMPGCHTMRQEEINRLLVKYAKSGKVVTRLKGGDPFVFGRGGEEVEVLVKNGIEYEVVPGITAGIAAPAYAGIPVTHRGLSGSFAMVTGHSHKGKPDNIKWKNLAKGVDTLAIYMGIRNLPYIVRKLIKYGKSKEVPVAVVEQGTTKYQQTIVGTLQTIVEKVEGSTITNPAMVIVGDVVNYHEASMGEKYKKLSV